MPDSPTYPSVYIDEIPGGARDITGVATSITAVLGRALRGPVNEPTRIRSFAAIFPSTLGLPGTWARCSGKSGPSSGCPIRTRRQCRPSGPPESTRVRRRLRQRKEMTGSI